MRNTETIYNEVLELIEDYMDKIVNEDFDDDAETIDIDEESDILRCFLEVVMVKLYDALCPDEFNDLIKAVRQDVIEEYNLN